MSTAFPGHAEPAAGFDLPLEMLGPVTGASNASARRCFAWRHIWRSTARTCRCATPLGL